MIKAIAFDWSNTLMREIPLIRRPSARSPQMEVVPGVTSALKELHQQFLCCIASNARGPEASALNMVLERAGLAQYIGHVFTAQELGAPKPEARFFHSLLYKLMLKPHECVMIGDDYNVDIAGAKAVGMKTIWFIERTNQEARDADVVIGAMSELATAVGKLAAQGEREATRPRVATPSP
ncbi:MAG: HAD family hydrolase [Chloroflexi bacterium]|nr:HAD family hydrolase [Chloroflexota bacterium]